jgi:hypothetical protein
MNRRDVLRLIPACTLVGRVLATEPPAFERIDTHVHIGRQAPQLISELKATHWRGVNISVSGVSGSETFDLEERLCEALQVCRDSGGTLAWASTFDARSFESPGFTDRTIDLLRRTFDDGAIAVKIWKNIGMAIKSKSAAYLLPDDPSLLPIYEAIQKANKTLIAHLAEPNGAWLPLDAKNPEIRYYSNNPQWHMHGKAGAPVKAAILEARDRVLARYPKLRVVGCHLGSDEDDLQQLARRLDAYPNFAVDTAARIRYFARGDREQVRQFLIKYQDRILYATDFALREDDAATATRKWQEGHNRDWNFFAGDEPMEYDNRPTRGLGLPEPVLKKLYRENALHWFPGLRA